MLVAFLLLSLAAAARTIWLRFRPSAVAHLALVFAGALLLFPAAAMAEPGQRPGSTDHAAPSGLVVVRHVNNSPQQDRALEEQALNNPFISGVGFQIHWSDIELVEGKPDWSKLDELFAAAEKSKKWVQLCIYPGFFSPAWALEGVKTEKFPVQYGPEKGTVLSLPMPWDRAYLNHWFAFLKQLSERYGQSPAFRMIAADGPTSVSEEMTLPSHSPPAVKKWLSDGYTPAKYLGAWEKAFHVYADSFPNQCVSLAAPGLPILERGNPVVLRVCAQSKTSSNGQSRSLDTGLQFNRTIFMPATRRSKLLTAPILSTVLADELLLASKCAVVPKAPGPAKLWALQEILPSP